MNPVFSFSSVIIAKYKKKVQNKHSNLFCTLEGVFYNLPIDKLWDTSKPEDFRKSKTFRLIFYILKNLSELLNSKTIALSIYFLSILSILSLKIGIIYWPSILLQISKIVFN